MSQSHKSEHEFFVNAFRLVDVVEGTDFQCQYYVLWESREAEGVDFAWLEGFVPDGAKAGYDAVLRELVAFFCATHFYREKLAKLKHLRGMAYRVVQKRKNELASHRGQSLGHVEAIKMWNGLLVALNNTIARVERC